MPAQLDAGSVVLSVVERKLMTGPVELQQRVSRDRLRASHARVGKCVANQGELVKK